MIQNHTSFEHIITLVAEISALKYDACHCFLSRAGARKPFAGDVWCCFGYIFQYVMVDVTLFINLHYSDVRISLMTSQITGVPIVCSTVGSGAGQRTHQSFASLTFVRGIHWWLVVFSSQRANDVKIFSFDDVILSVPLKQPSNNIRESTQHGYVLICPVKFGMKLLIGIVEVWAWMSNFVSYFIMVVVICPCWE